jgi:hypothetical protein
VFTLPQVHEGVLTILKAAAEHAAEAGEVAKGFAHMFTDMDDDVSQWEIAEGAKTTGSPHEKGQKRPSLAIVSLLVGLPCYSITATTTTIIIIIITPATAT